MIGLKCVIILCVAVAAFGADLTADDVQLHLFTRTNPGVSQPISQSVSSLTASNFGTSRSTVITIHTNGQNVSGNFNAFVVRAHLNTHDVNVISVDWFRGAGAYTQGLANAVQCGQIIADFIDWMFRNFNYSPSLYRIVGHGLGGHIAGIVARRVTSGQIPHIVAIDPSFFGWTHHPEILSPAGAGIVEVLHATAGTLGYDYKLGHLDFYANGGSHQPGCGSDVSCSHTYAYAFYAESITQSVNGGDQFVGTACQDYQHAISQNCTGERDAIFGGVDVKTSGYGYYSFATNALPPFAQG